MYCVFRSLDLIAPGYITGLFRGIHHRHRYQDVLRRDGFGLQVLLVSPHAISKSALCFSPAGVE